MDLSPGEPSTRKSPKTTAFSSGFPGIYAQFSWAPLRDPEILASGTGGVGGLPHALANAGHPCQRRDLLIFRAGKPVKIPGFSECKIRVFSKTSNKQGPSVPVLAKK